MMSDSCAYSKKAILAMAFLCSSVSITTAFQIPAVTRVAKTHSSNSLSRIFASVEKAASSIDNVNGDADASHKFSSLLEEVGLNGENGLQSIQDLPVNRGVSTNEVFCNRELKLGNIRAIGFGRFSLFFYICTRIFINVLWSF